MSVPTQKDGGADGMPIRVVDLRGECIRRRGAKAQRDAENVRGSRAFVSQAQGFRQGRMEYGSGFMELGRMHSTQRRQGAEGRRERVNCLVISSEARGIRQGRMQYE